ncbi:MAG: DivIVA domain-containing protein [Oscillospiraceae bacterium]|jgi:cell division initiation protein|nr:DivIVA domain-containing protein [Oscillospiraceae bacterium]
MLANDLLQRKFERALNGYKAEDVDGFLREIYEDYQQFDRNTQELEKKLTILAAKIGEYKEQEDDIKKALIVAQKESSRIISASRKQADEIITDATTEHDRLIAEGEKILSDSQRTALTTEQDLESRIAESRNMLRRYSNLILKFKTQVFADYQKFLIQFENIPEYENNSELRALVGDNNTNNETETE